MATSTGSALEAAFGGGLDRVCAWPPTLWPTFTRISAAPVPGAEPYGTTEPTDIPPRVGPALKDLFWSYAGDVIVAVWSLERICSLDRNDIHTFVDCVPIPD